MGLLETILISIGLAMDAFAVSLGIGAAGKAKTPRPIMRLAFHFGFFQGLMTLLGWLAGATVANFISAIDHWVAFVLLAFVGGRMLKEGLENKSESEESSKPNQDPSRGGHMVMLCIAVSLDAMAVGLTMALIQVDILWASAVIAVITFALSLVGLIAGAGLGAAFGKRMEVAGGGILIFIGLRILYTHLFVL